MTEQQKEVKVGNLLTKLCEHFGIIIDKYMSQFPRYEELKKFMTDDSNLYDENGIIKDEYKTWIKDVEEYSKNHKLVKSLEEIHSEDPTWNYLYEGIMQYIQSNEEMMRLYEESNKKEGIHFDVEKWIYEQFRKQSDSDDEANMKMGALIEMLDNETLVLLDENAELKDKIKETIEKNGQE